MSCFYAGGQAIALRTVYSSTDVMTSTSGDTSSVYYLHHDYLGNPSTSSGQALTEVTDEDGIIVGRARYNALGAVLQNTIPAIVTGRLSGSGLVPRYAQDAAQTPTPAWCMLARVVSTIRRWVCPCSPIPSAGCRKSRAR